MSESAKLSDLGRFEEVEGRSDPVYLLELKDTCHRLRSNCQMWLLAGLSGLVTDSEGTLTPLGGPQRGDTIEYAKGFRSFSYHVYSLLQAGSSGIGDSFEASGDSKGCLR